jgi:putative tryptophan/tyrosine transport system substrate-binding protein
LLTILALHSPAVRGRRGAPARLVDKTFKGIAPGEVPVQVNPTRELAINLKVAKALGLTIAPELLYSTDRLMR